MRVKNFFKKKKNVKKRQMEEQGKKHEDQLEQLEKDRKAMKQGMEEQLKKITEMFEEQKQKMNIQEVQINQLKEEQDKKMEQLVDQKKQQWMEEQDEKMAKLVEEQEKKHESQMKQLLEVQKKEMEKLVEEQNRKMEQFEDQTKKLVEEQGERLAHLKEEQTKMMEKHENQLKLMEMEKDTMKLHMEEQVMNVTKMIEEQGKKHGGQIEILMEVSSKIREHCQKVMADIGGLRLYTYAEKNHFDIGLQKLEDIYAKLSKSHYNLWPLYVDFLAEAETVRAKHLSHYNIQRMLQIIRNIQWSPRFIGPPFRPDFDTRRLEQVFLDKLRQCTGHEMVNGLYSEFVNEIRKEMKHDKFGEAQKLKLLMENKYSCHYPQIGHE